MKVAVTGATGLIGRRVVEVLLARGDRVVPLSRGDGAVSGVPLVRWDPAREDMPAAALDGVDAVVNLAGESLDGRWTEGRKRAIRESRVVTTGRVAQALAGGSGPRVLVNGSAVGFYGDRGDEVVDERTGRGTGFLASVCEQWEVATEPAAAAGVRVAISRTGVVLTRAGGALPKLAMATRMFISGPLAGGRQWVPWVALDDAAGILVAALDDEAYRGPVNAVSPNPVRQRDLASALGRVLHRPAVLPAPAFGVRLLLGDMGDMVLEGQRVTPAAALAAGYDFRQPDLEPALRAELDTR